MIQYQVTLKQIPRLWLELLSVTGLVGLVITMILQGKEIDAILPTLGLFAASAFRLMPSITRIIAAVQQNRFGIPAVNTLNKELKLKSTDDPRESPFYEVRELLGKKRLRTECV